MNNFITVILVIVVTLIGSVSTILLKLGSAQLSFKSFKKFIKFIINKHVILAVIFFAASFILYLSVLKVNNLSFIYPMMSLSYLWVALFSHYYLKEKFNKREIIGLALIIMGVVIISLG
jgi:drug/metabolite transporter (DMT)-like permease